MSAVFSLLKGIDFASKGSLLEAENCFREALSLSETGTVEERNSLANLLKALAEQGKDQQIINILENSHDSLVVSLPPMPLLIGAEVALKKQKVVLSMKLFRLLNSNYPNQKQVVLGLSSAMVRAGQLYEAQQLLKEFQLNSGPSSEVVTNLAIVALELGNLEQAETGYRIAQQLEQQQFVTNYNLAKFLQTYRGLEEALKFYNQCLSILPTAFEARIEKADVLAKLNRRTEAITIYKSLVYQSDLRQEHKNHAVCQYLYMLSEGTSPELFEAEADIQLKDISINYTIRSLIYDLSETQQSTHGGTIIYQPGSLVREFPVISTDDEILIELAQEINANPTLVYNRANKPTLGGAQTHEILVSSSASINKLFSIIKDNMINYGSLLPSPIQLDPTKEYIISGWAVSLHTGGRQLRHTHPEASISAVFYIQVPKEIEQSNDDYGCLYFSKRRADQQVDEIKIKPVPGKLVMFPSFFPHETINFTAQTERLCIACNLLKVV